MWWCGYTSLYQSLYSTEGRDHLLEACVRVSQASAQFLARVQVDVGRSSGFGIHQSHPSLPGPNLPFSPPCHSLSTHPVPSTVPFWTSILFNPYPLFPKLCRLTYFSKTRESTSMWEATLNSTCCMIWDDLTVSQKSRGRPAALNRKGCFETSVKQSHWHNASYARFGEGGKSLGHKMEEAFRPLSPHRKEHIF